MSDFLPWFACFRRRRPVAPAWPAPQPPAVRAALGIVAGRGVYPLELCRAARRQGVNRLVVVALQEETDPAIVQLADSVDWVHVGQLRKTMACFSQREVSDVMFAGQIRPARLFGGIRPDFLALRLLWSLKERNAHSLFGAVADTFAQYGFHVLPAVTYLDDLLAPAGVIGRIRPTARTAHDVEFGLRIAREVARLDIGQTVVVRNGTVLAVEGFEGTDQAIRRGGELGKGGVTVVKVAKPGHDLRFDVPCIGRNTVESLRVAGALALAVQAGKTLFLEKEVVLRELDAARIAVLGIAVEDCVLSPGPASPPAAKGS